MNIVQPSGGSSIYKIECDFISNVAFSSGLWGNPTTAGGQVNAAGGSNKHPGQIALAPQSTANSGGGVMSASNAFILSGSEKTTIIFQPGGGPQATITRRIGFHNSTSNVDATDGVYAEIFNGVITGKTANNSVRSVTGSSYTTTVTAWYRLVIELDTALSLAKFTLYADDSTNILWQDTLAANIPTGRVTGHGDFLTSSAASYFNNGGVLDYMSIELPTARRII